MGKLTAADYIRRFDLEAHVEGGYFKQTYKSDNEVKPLDTEKYNNETRSASTLIYFLLEKENFSAWHVLKSEETWHFYDGCPTLIHVINPDTKKLTTHLLGHPGDDEKANFQVIIKAGDYFAAEVQDKSSFSLVGCSVTPGFDYKDFELSNRKALAFQFPQHQTIIERMTREKKIESSLDSVNTNENRNNISLSNK